MIARLLLVVLVILNLSAAAWWLFHRDTAMATTVGANAVPALQLADAAHAPTATTTQAATIPADAVCASFGPFADATSAEQARQQLRAQAIRVDARQVAQSGRGYDVILPPEQDAAGAALLDKLKAAGIKDMFVIRDGADANGVALGHFGSPDGAQRRVAELQGKDFQPHVRPGGQALFWLDVAAAAGFDPAQVRDAVHATHGERVACPATSG
ncbi:SPOR domain-containing protein [Solilutibacter silvestris]|uniref:Sporulation related domain-containing protein n=1 Tax=Solilutibacter silvestris TaxID=1645665 RepID=A0A2K1Q2A4_9GAMM|nr:SPOR domain-containing protein [Lysobacter silvestris]PNS09164.1 Sporulation related domain-containing protein [Lysobacter silvestris]